MEKKWPVSMEGEKDKAPLLTEGWHEFEIVGVKLVSEKESGSGNAYFHWDMRSEEGSIPMRTTLIKGKRWLLKQVLLACGIKSREDDPEQKYAFGPEDVEGKKVLGRVANKTGKPFTGRDGELVEPQPKSEIVTVKEFVEAGAGPEPDSDKIPF